MKVRQLLSKTFISKKGYARLFLFKFLGLVDGGMKRLRYTPASSPSAGVKKSRTETASQPPSGDSTLFIYTDGSDFKHAANRKIGGGAVFIHGDKSATMGWTFEHKDIMERFKIPGSHTGSFSNPTAEMLAAANALKHAKVLWQILDFNKIVLCADYIQVFQYGSGLFRRPRFDKGLGKTAIYQKAVVEFLNALAAAKQLCGAVEIRHVKGHSGDPNNELADTIAKQGAGAPNTLHEVFPLPK